MDFDSEFAYMCAKLGEFKTQVIRRMFMTADSDADRIVMIAGMAREYDCLSMLLEKSYASHQLEQLKPLKATTLSSENRAKGNHSFQNKLYFDAISFYNQSILSGEGESLALGYANRSVAFFDTGDWLYSLRDIQMALDNNYPKKLQYKLRERQANCWFLLKDKKQSMISYMLARDLLIAHPIEDQTRMANIVAKLNKFSDTKVDIGDSMTNIKRIEQEVMKKRDMPPILHKSGNPMMPSASSAVKLINIPGRGRCLIATEDLKLGTSIIVEQAFASVLMREFNQTHCHYCLYWTPGPIPCLRCSQVGFCSTICRDKAWMSYHKEECGFFDLLQRSVFNETLLLALRTVLKADQDTISRLQTNNQPEGGVYQSTDYERVHQLVGHSSQLSWDDTFRRSVLSVYMIGLLRGESDIELSIELLRLLQSIPLNVFSINQFFLPPKSSPTTMDKITPELMAVAVLPVSSLMNHSCEPNVTRKFHGDVIAVKVHRPIKQGGEILTNYGYRYSSHSKDERQSKLKEGYFFDCTCQPCIENWPLDINLPKLPGRSQLSRTISKDRDHFYSQKCWYSVDNSEIEKWTDKFVGHLNALDGNSQVPHPLREYNEIQDIVNLCYDLLAATGPNVEKQTASSDIEKSFRTLYLSH